MKTTYSARPLHADATADFQAQTFVTLVDTGPIRVAAAFTGTSGNDTFTGTDTNDTFDLSQGGNDRASGGGGYDYFFFGSTLTGQDRVDGGDGTVDEVGIRGDYTLTITSPMFRNVEALFMIAGGDYNITLAAGLVPSTGAFSIYGGTDNLPITTFVDATAMANTLFFFGSSGDDSFRGGAGNDFFRFRVGGNDFYDGGTGINRVSLSGASAGVTFDLRAVGPQAVGAGFVSVRNIQDVSGSFFADTLTGTNGDNWFLSNGGNDVLSGLAGNDLFTVGPINLGSGPVFATAGVVDGGRGEDVVDFFANAGNTAGVTVSLQESAAQDTGQGVYQLIAIESVTGTAFDDTITGDAKANSLYGSNGMDRLVGGAGNDFLYGDAFYGIDSPLGANGPQYINFNLDASFADTLEGGRGRDRLDGGGGNDLLIGGADADVLIGGLGADLFSYSALSDSTRVQTDVILDFDQGFDKIDLSRIDADPATRGDQAFSVGATPGRVGNIVVSYDQETDLTTLSLFVDGDNRADMTISLAGQYALTDADFIL